MKFPSIMFGAMLFVSALAIQAAITDDMLIYSDRLNNMSEAHCNYESN